MDKLSHYLSMASICSGRALEDKARRTEWLNWAEAWNELAGEALAHPFKAEIANRSSDLAESNYETVE
jgi:sugar phosphate isomerase/epimerase